MVLMLLIMGIVLIVVGLILGFATIDSVSFAGVMAASLLIAIGVGLLAGALSIHTEQDTDNKPNTETESNFDFYVYD